MKQVICTMIEHPIRTMIVLDAVTMGIARIISATKGVNVGPAYSVSFGGKEEKNETE